MAILLTNQILKEAGISETDEIQIIVNPAGGLLLQSVDDEKDEFFKSFNKIKRKYSRLFRRLADR